MSESIENILMNDEVKEKKKEDNNLLPEILEEQEDIDKFYEKYLCNVKEGSIIKGKIVKIIGNEVIVDVNYKSEGIIHLHEFEVDEEGKTFIKEGDEIDVFIESIEEEDGKIVISKKKADRIQNWDKIIESYEKNVSIEGKVIEQIRGGYKVEVDGVDVFLPNSQVGRRENHEIAQFIGKKINLKIITLDREKRNVIVSRRIQMEERKEEKKKKILEEIEPGQIREGIIKNIVSYGAFIGLGEIDGLLHISDMSWRKIKDPGEILSVGNKISVVVLSVDKENNRIALGLKQKTEDPWHNIDEKYPIDSRVNGKVLKLTDYGAFVELEEGIEGLVHISEMSWTKRIKQPKELLSLDEIIEVVVLKIEKNTRRISLGIKQLNENPWLTVDLKYPINSVVEGVVKNLTDFGAFVEIADGIESLIHISDMAWLQNIQHPDELLKVGDKVTAVVLYVDKESKKIALGLKQLMPDPWESILEKYKEGNYLKGKVKRITSFGAFIEIEPNIEGLLHISQVALQKIEKIEEKLTVGQEVWTKVIKIDQEERKIGLSIKEYLEETEGEKTEQIQNN